jgi:hypothetical protein
MYVCMCVYEAGRQPAGKRSEEKDRLQCGWANTDVARARCSTVVARCDFPPAR